MVIREKTDLLGIDEEDIQSDSTNVNTGGFTEEDISVTVNFGNSRQYPQTSPSATSSVFVSCNFCPVLQV